MNQCMEVVREEEGDRRWFCVLDAGHEGCHQGLFFPPRGLSAGEERSLEKVAALRGYAGQLRAALRDAYDNTANGTTAHSIIGNALAISPPEGA